MIGSGVFLLPASLAPYGSVSIVGWIVTSLGAIVLALVFGRLARISTRTGGPYAWTRDGFDDFAGFLVAWGYWIALWAGNAAVAVAFTGYLGFFFPVIGQNAGMGLTVALAAIWTVAIVNIRGIQGASMVQMVTTVLKILPLIAVIVLGLAYLQPDNLQPFNPSDGSIGAGIAATAALTLWAFLGLESATVPAGDVRDPARTIPIATIVGVLLTATIYILVTVAVFGLMPREDLAGSTAPLADAMRNVAGATGGALIALGACISTFGTLNGFTLLAGQIPLGAARDGVFPRWFEKTTRSGTPARALVVSGVLSSGLVAMNFSKGLVDQFNFIILLATLTTLVPYIFCALAEIMIWLRNGRASRPPQWPAFVLGGMAFVYSIWAVYGAGKDVVYFGFLLLLLGVPVHVAITWRGGANRTSTAERRQA